MQIDLKAWKAQLAELFRGIAQLIYPNTCAVCHEGLVPGEEVLCSSCLYNLPRTRAWLTTDNMVARQFWGRIPIELACSLFHFAKGSRYQHLLHLLKYAGRRDIGLYLGQQLGIELAQIADYSNISAIVPVPLHPKKQQIRGYNQSQAIAEGIALRTGWHIEPNVLIRQQFTQTQTHKNRDERMLNVANAFAIQQGEKLRGQHVLLVDDVITTGATLEQCAQTLLNSCQNIRISIASLAYSSGI